MAIGGDPNIVYLIIANLGTEVNSGMAFINGFTWLERFYTVLDTANDRIGFAETPFTFSTPN